MEENSKPRIRIKRSVVIRVVAYSFILLSALLIWWLTEPPDIEDREPGEVLRDFTFEVSEIDLEQLRSYGIPIVLVFGITDTERMQEMLPYLKEMNLKLYPHAFIKYVDLREYPSAVADFPVLTLPTQVFYADDGNAYVPDDVELEDLSLYYHRGTGRHEHTVHEGALSEDELAMILADMGVEWE